MYFILDTLPDSDTIGDVWEAYLPNRRILKTDAIEGFPQAPLAYVALATITLMIENIIGLSISLPRRTWTG